MRIYSVTTRIAILLVVGAIALPARADDAANPRIRVLCYNIHHGRGTDGRIDLPRIANIIRAAEPDLVALNECDRNTRRSGGVDQPAELGRLTGLKSIFEKNIDFDGGEYGNAVLSRLSVMHQANHALPSMTEGEQRGLLEVVVRLADGGPALRFLATHLDYRPNDAERLASYDAIEKHFEQENGTKTPTPDPSPADGGGGFGIGSKLPTILAGDLNAVWDSQVMARFRKTWQLANPKPLFTFPAKEPKRQIDYVLVRPADRWRVRSMRVLDEPVASDHRPIWAELELR
jgi:endonuclease/exonuclease/phosphatase family metal-dependent hydrolase